MAQNKEQPISLKFLFFFTVFIIVILVYATTPNEIKQIKKSKTFEEMLEYTNTKQNSTTDINSPNIDYKKEEVKSAPIKNQNYISTVKNNYISNIQPAQNTMQEYYDLLDRMQKYPAKSINSAENIVKDILRFKGYPEYTIRVISDEASSMKQKTQGSYVAATFNISSGVMHINKVPLYALNIEEIIAIIAHELDHFDKIAQICKYMGMAEFQKLLNDNNMQGVNYEFWNKAQKYADINGFRGDYYKDALIRYINQGSIDLVSSYSDLYRLSEHVRNPLELSAYEVSDFIFEYYNLPNEEGPLRKLISKFNGLDWTIYNLINQNEIIQNERIAFFDYYFMNAIISEFPKYREVYNDCIVNKNGDMTSFWLAFEKDNESFYNKTMQLDEKTYKNIMQLLEKTNELAKGGINQEIICTALKLKVNTLLLNIVFPNAIKYIKSAAYNYLRYIKQNNITNSKDELQMILVLLCIENDLYTNKNSEIPSLYYINLPKELERLYSITNKNRKFHFIYKNKEFENILKEKKAQDASITDQKLLSELLYSTRLNDRIKH